MRTFGYSRSGNAISYDPVKVQEDVEGYLSEKFSSDVGRYSIGFLDRQADLQEAIAIYENRYDKMGLADADKKEFRKDRDQQLRDGSCLCVFTTDLDEGKDYHIFLPSNRFMVPPHLAEEMLHGMHYLRHVDLGEESPIEAYYIKFGEMIVELIGSLGLFMVGSVLESMDDSIRLLVTSEFGDYDMATNYISHKAGKFLVKSYDDSNMRKIFDAKDRSAVWDTVSGIIGRNKHIYITPDRRPEPAEYRIFYEVMSLNPGMPIGVQVPKPGKDNETMVIQPSLFDRLHRFL